MTTQTDNKTAQAFANSWNNLPNGSVYTHNQFVDWFLPLTENDIQTKRVLELGCGNGSLLVHLVNWKPDFVEGVDLGDSILSANENLNSTGFKQFKITKGDLTTYRTDTYDIVYCIGVLQHIKEPEKGFESVILNTKHGGRFHCWVYAYEGNFVVRTLVEPLRRIFSNFPWWFTKYCVATPLVVPYFLYAKLISLFKNTALAKKMPMYDYSCWISEREFSFFRHVAFDQLVTPQTVYFKKSTIEKWLKQYPQIEQDSTYIIFRNGNSWKFGGKLK